MKISYAVCSDIGTVRFQNQDNIFLNGQTKPVGQDNIVLSGSAEQSSAVFSVCDGMGGEQSGEIAASLAVETLKDYPAERFSDHWKDYLEDANTQICSYGKRFNGRIGTTYASVLLHRESAMAVNVGDSRIYLIRESGITQLSRDHTEFQTLVDANVLKKEDFSRTKSHNRLIQHLGIDSSEMELEPHIAFVEPLQRGDCFLLCSDGLYGVVSDEELQRLVLNAKDEESVCVDLVDLALRQGSRDNVTALVVRVLDVSRTSKEVSSPTEPELCSHERTKSVSPDTFVPASLETPPAENSRVITPPDVPAPARSGVSEGAGSRPARSGPPFSLILFLLLLLAALGGSCFVWQYPAVNDVVGLNAADAKAILTLQGFTCKTSEIYDSNESKGMVLKQSVAAGKRTRRGSAVELTVSKGVEPVEIPDVVGHPENHAAQELESLGLQVIIVRDYSDSVGEGNVISQTPGAGIRTLPGTLTKLTVSKGAPPATIPSVVGYSGAAARDTLEKLGLDVSITETENPRYAPGSVISQSPETDTVLEECTKISLVVNRSAEPEKTTVQVPDVVGMTKDQAYRVLEDAGLTPTYNYQSAPNVSSSVVISQAVKPGKQVDLGTEVFFWVSQ